MTYGQRILLVAALMMGFFSYTSAISEVSVEPFGFSVSIEEDAEAEVELVLSNDGDEDVEFSIDSELIEEEENRQAGPRRDDPGDLLDNIDVPGGNCFGITYDYDENLLWGVWHEANSRMLAYDMEGEQQEELRLGITNGIGMAFDGEDLWVGEYGGNRQLYRVDREGEQLQTLNPNCTITGVAWDGENLWIAPYPSNFIRQVNPENGETIRELNTQGMFQSNWITIVYVPEHRDAPLWVFENHGNYFQLNIDEDRPEVVQDFQNQVGNQFGVCHDTENLWTTAPNRWNCYDDGVEEFYMLTFDPEEGVIVGDDAEAVNVLIESTDCEAGVYNILITIELAEPEEERDDPEQSLIEISAVITVGDPTFDLSGIVTDAATDEVVEDVTIEMDSFILIRYSDQDGEYSFDDLPPGEYELTFTAPDYLPTTEGFEIEEDDVELDIALLHSECTPSEDEFFMELEPDMEYVFEWEVDNGGNGPLTYQVERQLLGDASADPWELRQTRNAEEAADDNQLNGVLFIEDHCFISGGNNREDDNKIYIFNRDGELIREFDQFHQSDYGIRDMCWDGELIWGSDDGIIYGFDTDGELVHEIEGEANSYRSLTYDSDEDRFISADITSDIYISNRDGELVQTINRPGDVRTYGLAYWPDDPDDHNLYIFGRGEETDLAVNKVNLENGDLILVSEIDLLGGRPGGIHITNQLDVYSWVFMGIIQNTDQENADHLAIWQLEGRREWFQVDPEAGEIAADASQDFTLTLNSTDLPPDNRFQGELVFTHDGVGGQTVIPVDLNVVEGEVHTFRDLDFEIGWNLVSVNLQPDEEDVEVLMADLVEADLLEMMKDGAGHFYRPDYNFNNIPGWSVNEGYQVKMRDYAELRLVGWTVLREEPIDLESGWQIISYYPNFAIEATLALSRIEDHLIIAKDGYGNFYIPAWDYSNMGDMRAGRGYYVNVDENIELIYVFEREEATSGNIIYQPSVYTEPGSLPVHSQTGSNMSLLVHADPSLAGDIGVYASGNLVGSGVLQDGICGIAVWGDDLTTDVIDGAIEGEPLELKLLCDGNLNQIGYSLLSGKDIYNQDALSVIRLTGSIELPDEFAIVSAYPNPFNSLMKVSYSLPEAANIKLNVYDLAGRFVAELANGRHQAGIYTTTFDGSDLASGIYMIRFEAGGHTSQYKVTLVK